jgi:hypothetical protein
LKGLDAGVFFLHRHSNATWDNFDFISLEANQTLGALTIVVAIALAFLERVPFLHNVFDRYNT